ncbi:MAG: HYExAFE family protein [Phycisphaerae bacterium]|nr:HYExAFE family protein [Phycisphaerae bacterium]
MGDSSRNRYERAFEHWLLDHRVQHVRADEHRRLGSSHKTVKNFDFLLFPRPDRKVIVEVKGRTFAGATLVGLAGFDCWVTMDDIESLQVWRRALGDGHEAVFVFAYRVTQADVDFDGHEVLPLGSDRYVFFCVRLDDYLQHSTRRSPKWRTMMLPADSFRRYAVGLAAFLP